MKRKYMIILLVGLTSIILSQILMTSKYPKIYLGVSSENYTIEKITAQTRSHILYDEEHNYFIVSSTGGSDYGRRDIRYVPWTIRKIDSLGNEVFKTEMVSNKLNTVSHYILCKNGVIDLSDNSVELVKFSKIINAKHTMSEEEENITFDHLYSTASVALFYRYVDFSKSIGEQFMAYFKVKNNWILFHHNLETSGKYSELEDQHILTVKSRDEKVRRLKLLQHSKKGLSERCYRDIRVCGDIGGMWVPEVPVAWRSTISYSLKVDSERLKFQCYGEKGITSPVMSRYLLPDVYKSLSKVSFINISANSNATDERDFEGLYIIKKKNQLESKLEPLGLQMVQVEGGLFQMESDKEKKHEASQLTLKSFSIAKHEVTQALWENVMGKNPSYFRGEPLCSVENVDGYDIQKFLKELNQKYPGRNYRLPTEAEWEFAARGGNLSNGYTYSGSNDPTAVGWFRYKADLNGMGKNSWDSPHPVGQKQANELGIYDMTGNVNELTTSDIPGRLGMRGGSWSYEHAYIPSVTLQRYAEHGWKTNGLGFRLAADI